MTGIIILAAGSSSRLGRPKQNLLFKGKTLLQQTINSATTLARGPVVVVLGANADQIKIEAEGINIIQNPDWEQGMSASVKAGITHLQKISGVNSAIIMLCDQPHVNAKLLNSILQKQTETGKGIIASAYNQTLGVPVLFTKPYFNTLLSLKGHEGAKKLLSVYPDDIAAVDFEKGAIDIDTIGDYEGLIRS